MKHKPSLGCAPPEFIGTAVLGERGQVVIPKEVRDDLDLKAGSRLIVLRHENGAIILIPAEHIQDVLESIKKRFSIIQDAIKHEGRL